MTGSLQMTLSVSELNQAVKNLIETDSRFFNLCVTGELSNYKVYPSGHHYFTLKDQESSLRCVMFRSSAGNLRFRPENGMKVSALGSLKVYSREGAYQLYCSNLLPDGIGDLQLAFEQLKKRLNEEGLFDESRKKPLPLFPDRIALITSSAGAAVHDMIRILGQRWPLSTVILLPVRVQGKEAPAEIAGAIRYANLYKVADLIITGRGGGSLEDLWAFNDEKVARAVYASEIPVISAVGHEPDITISDYVADRRASTPSNAAEIAVPDRREMAEALEEYAYRLTRGMDRRFTQLRQELDACRKKRVLADPAYLLDMRRTDADRNAERLVMTEERLLAERKLQLGRMAAALDALSPLKVMARGYALARLEDGILVHSIKQLDSGTVLNLRVMDGEARCRVEEWKEIDG